MMDPEHMITPPKGLVRQLQDLEPLEAIRFAYRAGADWELGECVHEILAHPGFEQPELFVELLRAKRRPKPSLKAQALEALKHAEEGWRPVPEDCALIRRALEALPD